METARLAVCSMCVCLLLVVPAAAAARECGDGPAIAIEFVGEGWTPEFRERVGDELEAAVASQGFSVCPPGEVPGVEPVARVELRTNDLPRVAVTIEVHDEVTEKRVRRDVDLGEFTEDSRALALAVSADELLRASWMELALADRPPTRRRAPREVRRVVDREVEAASPRRTEIGVVFATRAYSEGATLLGGDAYFSYWATDFLGLELSFGAAFGLVRESTNGTVSTRTLGAAPALLVRFLDLEALSLSIRAGVRIDDVELDGTPNPTATARTDSGIAVTAQGAVVGGLSVGALVLRLEVGGGGVLRGVGATDDDVRVLAVGGAEVHGRLVIGVAL